MSFKRQANVFVFLATGFGVGYIPYAPGTFGSLISLLLFLVLGKLPPHSYIIFCVGFLFVSVWIVNRALPAFESGDPKEIVIDEIVGMLVALTLRHISFFDMALGFCLFRFFDISKLPPLSWVEKKVGGGWGVVLDDVIAGVYAFISLCIVHAIWR
jgi:phosphatidylglycerophosphatase A